MGIAYLDKIRQSLIKHLLPVFWVKVHSSTAACDWLTVNVMNLHWSVDHTPFVKLQNHNRGQGQKLILENVQNYVIICFYVPEKSPILADI